MDPSTIEEIAYLQNQLRIVKREQAVLDDKQYELRYKANYIRSTIDRLESRRTSSV